MPKIIKDWHGHILSRAVLMPNGCLEWQGARQPRGYGQVIIGGKAWLVHRYIVYCKITDVLERNRFLVDNTVVRHSCDNPPCINWDHLIPGTQGENLQDAYDRGHRNAKGENNAFSKITGLTVIAIRQQYGDGIVTQKQLAAKYGISQAHVSLIVRREGWQHV